MILCIHMTSYGSAGQRLQKRSGISYYLATLFFAEPLRSDVFSLYGFVRATDDLVDNSLPSDVRKKSLQEFESMYQNALLGESCDSSVLSDFILLKKNHLIPDKYIAAFFDAMYQDTQEYSEYATYQDLEHYMYGSATVIGYIMTELIGFKGNALPAARALAEAMQLTNFLRDVREDYVDFKRIYIPNEYFILFDVSIEEFTNGIPSIKKKNLIKHLVAKAEELYQQSESGIQLLDPRGQTAVLLASHLYQGILQEIKKNDYDPWNHDCHTSYPTKIFILLKTLWHKK